MLNQVIIVGRLVNKIEMEKTENGDKKCYIKLAVPRSFKNMEGGYDTDFIKCVVYGSIAENTKEYCTKGDIIGIKGRIQVKDETMEIIAEKVTFLSSNKEEK